MEKGTVVLAFRAPVPLDFAGFADACRRASHRLRSLIVDIPGQFDGDAFVVDGSGQRLAVEAGDRPAGVVRLRARVDRWDAPVLRAER